MIVAITGGSGSGKTFLAGELKALLGDAAVVISMDVYYRDLGAMPKVRKDAFNWDHPDAFDHDGIVEDLRELKSGTAIRKRVYDYNVHQPSFLEESIEPAPVVIFEGVLALHYAEVLELADRSIFVDTPEDIMLIRRIQRDMETRGRSLDSVLKQYLKTVRPMYHEYVLPQKARAGRIVSGDAVVKPIAREIAVSLL
ncbi:MAG: uridine kinase [Lentimonas sp.]